MKEPDFHEAYGPEDILPNVLIVYARTLERPLELLLWISPEEYQQ